MQHFTLQRLSIDLSNRCSKACDFCYNRSFADGNVVWQPHEVIDLVKDCVKNGLQAVSLGGGEPFEYEGVFGIISALTPLVFVSVTSNGLPLKNMEIWEDLIKNKPDKIHFTIHHPESEDEIYNALYFTDLLKQEGIKAGINLLVSSDRIEETKQLTRRLAQSGISRKEIIFVPRRFSLQPTPQQVLEVAGSEPFQSPSCLITCRPGERFCSLSWDKRINFCSYSPSKAMLQEISHRGIINALNSINFKSCMI
jgi:MoaA/NifB/PqqE/SkfB family radical SAM enzyme